MLGTTACKTVEYVPVEIPSFSAVRPERPVLETENSMEAKDGNLLKLMIYGRQWEAYGDGVEAFLEELKGEER